MVDHDAWIHMPSLEEADGELRFLYERLRDRRTGEVDNILRIHGQHPATLAAHHELYRVLMHGPSGLSRRQREMVAVMGVCHQPVPLLTRPPWSRSAPPHRRPAVRPAAGGRLARGAARRAGRRDARLR